MYHEDDVSRDHRILGDHVQENLARASIYDRFEVISERNDSSRKRHAKQIADLLRAEHIEQNGIREIPKKSFACIQFVRDTNIQRLKNPKLW